MPVTDADRESYAYKLGVAEQEIKQLREALRQSLRQWKMYAEDEPDRDMQTEASTEAALFRAHWALAKQR
jgi:hypothetical protein